MVEVLERYNMWKLEFQLALNDTDEKACNKNNYVYKNNIKHDEDDDDDDNGNDDDVEAKEAGNDFNIKENFIPSIMKEIDAEDSSTIIDEIESIKQNTTFGNEILNKL